MTNEQRKLWAWLSGEIRKANAVCDYLASGFVDTHGHALGDPEAAARLVMTTLTEAAVWAKRIVEAK